MPHLHIKHTKHNCLNALWKNPINVLNIQRHNHSHPEGCVSIHLGSKRGVMSGVEPMTEDSRRLLAGVIKGFLVDLRTKHKHGSSEKQTTGLLGGS